MFTTPRERALRPVNLFEFDNANLPGNVGHSMLRPPIEEQHILRMIIKLPHESFKVPKELQWTADMVMAAVIHQKTKIGVAHPFVYLTVRHGLVVSETDDEWHTDGFSTKITHLPEQNYIWVDTEPTEYTNQHFYVPQDFNPLKHNLHKWLAQQVESNYVQLLRPCCIFCLDPYVVHRRPPSTKGMKRTFVRVSFVPVEIMDDANTPNPLIPMRKYGRDGITIRNNLTNYGE